MEAQRDVERCRIQSDEFFADVLDWVGEQGKQSPRVSRPGIVQNRLSPALTSLGHGLKDASKKLKDEQRQDFIAAAERLLALASEIEGWRTQSQAGTVYWIDVIRSRRGHPRITLAAGRTV
jgi:hypothetical protein